MSIEQHGIHVYPGQVWKDCDPRMDRRRVRVTRVEDGKAYCDVLAGGTRTRRTTKLRIRRMHPSGTGWRLIEEEAK